MKEKTVRTVAESGAVCNCLGVFARQWVHNLLQRVLEEEVEATLGRRRYESREGLSDAFRTTVGARLRQARPQGGYQGAAFCERASRLLDEEYRADLDGGL